MWRSTVLPAVFVGIVMDTNAGAATGCILLSVAVGFACSVHHPAGVAQSLCIAGASGKGFVSTHGTARPQMRLRPNVFVSFWFEQLEKKTSLYTK